MKVLIVVKKFPPEVGGVESYSEFVARAYLSRSIEPVVVSSWKGKRGWHVREYPEGKIRVYNTGKASQPVVFARMVFVCARIRLAERFDILHATTWRPALAIWPFRRGTPSVLTVHGQEVLIYPPFFRRVMSWVLASADVMIAVSDTTMQVARGALFGQEAHGNWEVSFNGLSYRDLAKSFDRTVPPESSPVRILSFARLAERKNISRCLDALAQLRDEGITNFEYIIAGTGPLRDSLAAQIVRLNLSKQVRMTGYVAETDIPDLYRNSDVFLHPQTGSIKERDLEGFGLVIADAMSFGAAPIVGKAGGPADFVKHGERGLVVDGNDTSQIASALRLYLTDPEYREQIARVGRDWCLANLSWEKHVDVIIKAIDRKP